MHPLTLAQMFGVGVPAICKHLSHIFEEGELNKEVVVSKTEITTQHGAIEDKIQSKEVSHEIRPIKRRKKNIVCLTQPNRLILTLTSI